MSRRRRSKIRSAQGFSLLETLIASSVLAFAVAAVSQSIVAGQMQTYEALHELRATSLAEAMLEEVLSKPYNDPDGVTTGEVGRSTWDDIVDFNGYSEDAGTVADVAGVTYPSAYSEFSRSIAVANGTLTIPGFDQAVSGKNVTITVTDTKGKTWSVTRFVSEPAS